MNFHNYSKKEKQDEKTPSYIHVMFHEYSKQHVQVLMIRHCMHYFIVFLVMITVHTFHFSIPL